MCVSLSYLVFGYSLYSRGNLYDSIEIGINRGNFW